MVYGDLRVRPSLKRALLADIDTDGQLLDIFLSQGDNKFELKWDHLVALKKKGQRSRVPSSAARRTA